MIVAYEPMPDFAAVTILGEDGQPSIVLLDLDDLDRCAAIAAATRSVDQSLSQEDRVRITPRGMDWLRDNLSGVSV